MADIPFNINERRLMDRREDPDSNPILTQILQQYNCIRSDLEEFKEDYRPYMDFIKQEYDKRKRRDEIWSKTLETVLGWGVIGLVTSIAGVLAYVGHYFWQLIKHDIGLK